jgi:hypothetical protein
VSKNRKRLAFLASLVVGVLFLWWAGFLQPTFWKVILGRCPAPGTLCDEICRGKQPVFEDGCPQPVCSCDKQLP